MKFTNWIQLRESNEENGFAVRIKSQPKEMTNWLVYADWLQERDDPRAELIRTIINKKAVADFYAINPIWEKYGRTDFAHLLGLSFPLVRYALGFSGKNKNVNLGQTAEIINLIDKQNKANLSSGKEIELTLRQINKLLNGFGIQVVTGDQARQSYWMDAVAAYVNKGDTYDLTVIFDTIKNKFVITSLGDFVEKNQNRYGIN